MKRITNALKGLWSLAVGLGITGVELCKPRITVHYPRQTVDNLHTYRGHIELSPNEKEPGTPKCILCMRCRDICPSGCIDIDMHVAESESDSTQEGLFLSPEIRIPGSVHAVSPPDRIERFLDGFRLDYSLCSLCGLCVQNCPTEAIRFSRNVYLTGTGRSDFHLDLLKRFYSG